MYVMAWLAKPVLGVEFFFRHFTHSTCVKG